MIPLTHDFHWLMPSLFYVSVILSHLVFVAFQYSTSSSTKLRSHWVYSTVFQNLSVHQLRIFSKMNILIWKVLGVGLKDSAKVILGLLVHGIMLSWSKLLSQHSEKVQLLGGALGTMPYGPHISFSWVAFASQQSSINLSSEPSHRSMWYKQWYMYKVPMAHK